MIIRLFLFLLLSTTTWANSSLAGSREVSVQEVKKDVRRTCLLAIQPPASIAFITCNVLPHYPGAKVLQMGHYPQDFPGPGLLASTEGFLSGQSMQHYLASGISDWITFTPRTASPDQEDDAIQLNEYGVDFLWATQPDEIKREKIRGKDWAGYLWTRRTDPTKKEMGNAAPKRPQRCFIALIGNQRNSLEFATCLARDRNPNEPNELHYRDFMSALKSIEFGQ